MYKYQRDGVRWMWGLRVFDRFGGILGDDMGLGKTMQVVTYVAGILSTRINGRVLVVAPKTLLGTWNSELDKWAPNIPKYVYDPDVALSHRKRNLSLVIEKGGAFN